MATEEMGDSDSKMKPTMRYAISALICLAFAVMGVAEMSRGPTLLDLVFIYRAELKVVSFMAILSSTGSIAGTLIAGMLNTRWPNQGFTFMFGHLMLLAVITLLIPRLGHVFGLLFILFAHGYACGAIDVGGNILCLEIWRGMSAGGPVFHSIHFAYSVGALLAPIASLPFLSSKTSNRDLHQHNSPSSPIVVNVTANGTIDEAENIDDVANNINNLYIIFAIGPALVSLGFLVQTLMGARGGNRNLEMSNRNIDENEHKNENNHQVEGESKGMRMRLRLIVVISGIMLATYVGTEVSTGTYLPAFGTLSALRLSKTSSANLASIFWAGFSIMRFVAIFLAMKLSPLATLTISFGLALSGSLLAIVVGQTSLISMQVACALLGLGFSTVYATCFLWVEDHLEVTPAIGTYFVVAAGIGNDISGVIMGQTLDHAPVALLYFILAGIVGSVILFLLMLFIAKPLPLVKKGPHDQEHVTAEGMERSTIK